MFSYPPPESSIQFKFIRSNASSVKITLRLFFYSPTVSFHLINHSKHIQAKIQTEVLRHNHNVLTHTFSGSASTIRTNFCLSLSPLPPPQLFSKKFPHYISTHHNLFKNHHLSSTPTASLSQYRQRERGRRTIHRTFSQLLSHIIYNEPSAMMNPFFFSLV